MMSDRAKLSQNDTIGELILRAAEIGRARSGPVELEFSLDGYTFVLEIRVVSVDGRKVNSFVRPPKSH